MTKRLILACAVAAFGTAAAAQNAPKPIPRADYMKIVDSRFNGGDTNHDGYVSKAELVAQQARDLDEARARIAKNTRDKFNQLDINHDGRLTLQEFMALAPAVRAGKTADETMQQFDSNHDGRISAEEFRAPEIAKFNKVDANHDGIVTPQEIQAANGRK